MPSRYPLPTSSSTSTSSSSSARVDTAPLVLERVLGIASTRASRLSTFTVTIASSEIAAAAYQRPQPRPQRLERAQPHSIWRPWPPRHCWQPSDSLTPPAVHHPILTRHRAYRQHCAVTTSVLPLASLASGLPSRPHCALGRLCDRLVAFHRLSQRSVDRRRASHLSRRHRCLRCPCASCFATLPRRPAPFPSLCGLMASTLERGGCVTVHTNISSPHGSAACSSAAFSYAQ
jgi:hypothetical protein